MISQLNFLKVQVLLPNNLATISLNLIIECLLSRYGLQGYLQTMSEMTKLSRLANSITRTKGNNFDIKIKLTNDLPWRLQNCVTWTNHDLNIPFRFTSLCNLYAICNFKKIQLLFDIQYPLYLFRNDLNILFRITSLRTFYECAISRVGKSCLI